MSHISPEKQEALKRRMVELGISEEDIEEQFIRARGRGGQKVNKTACCVRLLHRPTGIEVRCEESRSQASNRFFARRLLVARMEQQLLGTESPAEKERERIRRQKQRRQRRARHKAS